MSILHSSALTESFLVSYHSHHLPLYVPKLASLCLAWHATVWRSWFSWWRKFRLHFQGLQFLRLTLSLHVPLFSPDMFPQACSLMALHSFPDSSVWLRTDSELCPERVVPWFLSSCWACQDLQVFQVSVSVSEWMGRGQRRRRAGRENGRQAVGFWDHFALTHIPPFCSECLNMKTTQLLLTPAPPPKHSSND